MISTPEPLSLIFCVIFACGDCNEKKKTFLFYFLFFEVVQFDSSFQNNFKGFKSH